LIDQATFNLLLALFTISALLAGLQLPLITHFTDARIRAAQAGRAEVKERFRRMMDLCATSALMFVALSAAYLLVIIVATFPSWLTVGLVALLAPTLVLAYTIYAATLRKTTTTDLLEEPTKSA
jgi:hypothetical protein